jgi:hypothetical protein
LTRLRRHCGRQASLNTASQRPWLVGGAAKIACVAIQAARTYAPGIYTGADTVFRDFWTGQGSGQPEWPEYRRQARDEGLAALAATRARQTCHKYDAATSTGQVDGL